MIKSALIYMALGSVLLATGCTTRAQMNRERDDEPAQSAKPVDQGGYAVDELKSEITRLNGRLEDMERAQRDAKATGGEAKKLEMRVQELEKAQLEMLQAIKVMQTEQEEATVDPAQFFYDGRARLQQGEHESALKSLTRYLSAKGKKSHAEEATFLRGETYYAMKDYKRAIVDYSKFTDEFGKSVLTPKALFKIALSFEAMGASSDAKPFYQDLIEKFPKSPEAKEAAKRIAKSSSKKKQ